MAKDTVRMYLDLVDEINDVSWHVGRYGETLSCRVSRGLSCYSEADGLRDNVKRLRKLLATLAEYEKGNYGE